MEIILFFCKNIFKGSVLGVPTLRDFQDTALKKRAEIKGGYMGYVWKPGDTVIWIASKSYPPKPCPRIKMVFR
jgi:hypothetical protein